MVNPRKSLAAVLTWGMGAILYLAANHFWPHIVFRVLGYVCVLLTSMYLFRYLKERAAYKEAMKKQQMKNGKARKK